MKTLNSSTHALLSVLLCHGIILIVLFSDVPLSEAAFMPDTGQMTCYDAQSNALIPCANSGQDGEFPIHPMSLVPGGTDANTALVWQTGENPDNGITDCARYNWYEATGTYDAGLNPLTKNVCIDIGPNWRLPTKKELMTLIDYGITPASGYPPVLMINQTVFPFAVRGDYWSSSAIPAAYPVNSGYGWFVNFGNGQAEGTDLLRTLRNRCTPELRQSRPGPAGCY